MNLLTLQREVGEWSRKNFPNNLPHHPLLGLAEEVGELSHAHLKGEQGIRHSSKEIESMKADAVGDIIIYLVDYCERNGLLLQGCVDTTWALVQQRDWQKNPNGAHNG